MLAVALLADAPAGQALDIGDGPVLMFARDVRRESDGVIVAEGEVEILRGERRLLADSVRYDQRADRIEALGNITLVEPGGEVLYADRMVFSGDLRNGVASHLRARLQDNSLLAAAEGRRIDGTRTEMNQGVYSPCPICEDSDEPPLWQITAQQVNHDQETQDITYRHAFLEMFGVPVAYMPYFSHPDPTVDRRSGFLAPIFGSDSNLGFTVETPYYFNLAPNYDLTVAPIFTTQENAVLTADYRHLLENGRFDLGGSFTYATKPGSEADPNPKGQTWRGNIEGEGDFHLGNFWGWGYDLAVTSDDTYLDRYNFSDDERPAEPPVHRAHLEPELCRRPGLWLSGSARGRRPGHHSDRRAMGGTGPDERADAVGLARRPQQQRPGPDPQRWPGHAAAVDRAWRGSCPSRVRSAICIG